MSAPKLPPCHDLVRLIRPTLVDTVHVLKEHLTRSPGFFSYEPARQIAPHAFGGGLTLAALKKACFRLKNEAGREANWQAVQAVVAAGSGRNVQCFPMPNGFLQVRKDLSIKVSADFYFVENERAHVFWLQPRRLYALNEQQLGLFGALIRMTLLTDDFENTGLQLLDISAPDGRNRVQRMLTLDDLPPVSDNVVKEGIGRIVAAYDEVMAMGLDWSDIRRRRSGRERPSAQDSFVGI